MRTYLPIGQWIKDYLPDFCWQDYNEITAFLEGINVSVDAFSVRVTLGKMVESGILVREKFPTTLGRHRTIWKYRRI